VPVERVKGAFLRAVQSAFPDLPLLGRYRARVVSQAGTAQRFDVQPDGDTNGNQFIPAAGNVPLRQGLPGVQVTVAPGAYVLLGFMGGSRRSPYIAAWEGGETVLKISLSTTVLNLGSDTATEPFLLGNQVNAAVLALQTGWNIFQVALDSYINSIQAIADPPGTVTATMHSAIIAMENVINAFAAAITAARSAQVFGV
jgi:hypothetical protein